MKTQHSSLLSEIRLAWQAESKEFVPLKARPPKLPFIGGPLPLAWMTTAGLLPGKSLHVGLVLWYLAGLTKSTSVRLGAKPLERFGVSRDAKYEALRRLESAGLISVKQQPGQAPWVTIIAAPTSPLNGLLIRPAEV
jgi:hypothetical protein